MFNKGEEVLKKHCEKYEREREREREKCHVQNASQREIRERPFSKENPKFSKRSKILRKETFYDNLLEETKCLLLDAKKFKIRNIYFFQD